MSAIPPAPGAFIRGLSPGERAVFRASTWTCVFVEALGARVPRTFGDNAGVWPARVRSTGDDPLRLGQASDRASPVHAIEIAATFWFPDAAAADRIMRRVVPLLEERRAPIRHAWHDVEPSGALAVIKWACAVEAIEWFDDKEVHADIVRRHRAEAERRVRARF